MSECDPWPFESKDDPMEQLASKLLIRDAGEGLSDAESTARHPLVQRLDARLNRVGARFWNAVENRVIGMSNIEQARILSRVQKTIHYDYPYSAPICIENGQGYLTGCVSMPTLLGLKTEDELRNKDRHRDWYGRFRFRRMVKALEMPIASERGWRPKPELITTDPCGIVTLKNGAPWEVRPEFGLGFLYDPPDRAWQGDVREGEHEVVGEWRAVAETVSEFVGILTRMASGRLFA